MSHKKMKEMVNQFEKQFGVKTKPTGHESDDRDMFSKEYWVKGLIESKVPGIDIRVGGWFDYDKRSGTGHALLTIQFNGENIAEYEAIQSHYENGKWDDLYWDSF